MYHVIEFFLGVELIPLAESGIVVSDVFEDFIVESLSYGGYYYDAGCEGAENVGEFDH